MPGDALLLASRLVVGALMIVAAAVLVAAVVRLARRGQPVPWLVVVAVLALLIGSIDFPGAEVATGSVWFFGYPLLLAIYPDGRFIPRWSAVPALAWLPLAVAYAATGGAVSEQGWWRPVILVSWVALIGCQVYRYRRRAATSEREQVRWGLLGVLVEVSGFMVLLAVTGGIAEDGPASEALANLVGWPIPVALALGLAVPRLVRVDPILRGVVVVAVGGWTLAGGFAAALALARALSASPESAAWGAAAVLAVLVTPVLWAAGRVADWMVYGVRAGPAEAARRLRERLDALSPAEDIAAAVVEQTREATGSPQVRLARPSASDGFPVSYQGEVLAQLQIAPRPAESMLTARDRQVAEALAAQAAPALHGARALAELGEARAALVRARGEERKRLRRDLHDDLAPTLAGLGLGLSAVRELAPENLRPLVDEVQHGVRDAIAQTRQIAHGLRPAILDDHGLADAVRERARLLEAAGIATTVTDLLPAGRILPAAVEVAALLIAQEAIANVCRHSQARWCAIVLGAGESELEMTIEDDGVGIGSGGHGLGLGSMRDRAAELGGQAVIGHRREGGTRIAVRLPWEVEP